MFSIIRKHKTVLWVILFILMFLGYTQFQNYRSSKNQQIIINYLNVQSHAVIIQHKLDRYVLSGNDTVDGYILDLYYESYQLALKGDEKCYILELMGDEVKKAYNEGRKDGCKTA